MASTTVLICVALIVTLAIHTEAQNGSGLSACNDPNSWSTGSTGCKDAPQEAGPVNDAPNSKRSFSKMEKLISDVVEDLLAKE